MSRVSLLISWPIKRHLFVITAFMLCCSLLGCGYGFTGKKGTVLGDTAQTMQIKGVDQPTLYAWLPQVIRNSLREELSNRNIAVWRDNGGADYGIHITVNSFTMRSSVKDENSNSLLVSGNLNMRAVIYDEKTNAQVWTSGNIGHSETYESNNERAAAEELTARVMQKLANKMRSQF